MENEAGPNTILNVIAALGGFSGLAALAGVLYGFYTKRAEAKKLGADAEKTKADTMGMVVDGAGDLVEHYRKLVGEMKQQLTDMCRVQDQHTDQIKKLNRRVSRSEQRIIYLTDGIQKLIGQILALKETPVWTPSPWSPDSEDEDEPPGGRETPMPPGD